MTGRWSIVVIATVRQILLYAVGRLSVGNLKLIAFRYDTDAMIQKFDNPLMLHLES